MLKVIGPSYLGLWPSRGGWGIGCNGYDAEGIGCHTSWGRWPKCQILIITVLTVLVLWAERIDYNWLNQSINQYFTHKTWTK